MLANSAGVRSLLLLAVLAVAAGVVAVRHLPEDALAEPTHTNRPQEIRSIALDGRGLPVVTLRELLTTRAGDLLDADKLAHDREALEAALVARGYFAARVDDAKVFFDAGAGAFVTFAITQGPQFRVRSVKVTGATAIEAGVVTIAVGDVVMADRIARARAALADRLSARGKPRVVVANVLPDLAAGVVDIELAAAR